MLNFRDQAILRIEGFLKIYDTDLLAELLADVLHYADAQGIDLDQALDQARTYMTEELSFDEAQLV